MSPRIKPLAAVVKQAPDEPTVAPEPLPAKSKPNLDELWQEKCPNCECFDLQWYPVTMVPRVGGTAMRRCRQCRQSAVVKRLR